MLNRKFTLSALSLATVMLIGCDVDKTQDGELPSVDVDVEAGQLPEYDVETADIDFGTREATVSVPDVDVSMEETQVSVPTMDIDMPGDDEINRDDIEGGQMDFNERTVANPEIQDDMEELREEADELRNEYREEARELEADARESVEDLRAAN